MFGRETFNLERSRRGFFAASDDDLWVGFVTRRLVIERVNLIGEEENRLVGFDRGECIVNRRATIVDNRLNRRQEVGLIRKGLLGFRTMTEGDQRPFALVGKVLETGAPCCGQWFGAQTCIPQHRALRKICNRRQGITRERVITRGGQEETVAIGL